jgi:histidyl-tRNA synthetase
MHSGGYSVPGYLWKHFKAGLYFIYCMEFERPKGVRDFGPTEMAAHMSVTGDISAAFESFGYERVMTPSFEFLSLFEEKSGQDIKKHLYVFEDKGGRSMCLRPEATASVARMYGSMLRSHPKPIRLYYVEPMYRYEQPQRGRYREFWQAGVEVIGAYGPFADAEVVSLAYETLKNIGVEGDLRISHIGILRGLLSKLEFDEAKQNNVIHEIDAGNLDEVKNIVSDDVFQKVIDIRGDSSSCEQLMPILPDDLKDSALDLQRTLSLLDMAQVEYSLDFSMARGLDYYTGLIFDFKAKGLGAQNQVCGGGRYDSLIGALGGQQAPAVGFAFGVDRIVEALNDAGAAFNRRRCHVYVAAVSEKVRGRAFEISSEIRRKLGGLDVRFDIGCQKVGKSLQSASEMGAKYAVIVGEKELESESVSVKDMGSSRQESVKLTDLASYLSSD